MRNLILAGETFALQRSRAKRFARGPVARMGMISSTENRAKLRRLS